MRRRDKKLWMEHVNMAFEKRHNKRKPINEEISASEAYHAFSSMMTVLNGKRSVAFLLGPEVREYFNEYIKDNPRVGLMKVERDGHGIYGDAYILYTNGTNAQRLYDVLMKHEGYLSDDTPEEAIENGEALEYKAEDIKEFVDSHYGHGAYDKVKGSLVYAEDCGCSVNENEPTDVANSKWFSDEDGERIMDIQVD